MYCSRNPTGNQRNHTKATTDEAFLQSSTRKLIPTHINIQTEECTHHSKVSQRHQSISTLNDQNRLYKIKKSKNRARAQRNPKNTGIKQSRKETPQKITASHKKKDYKHTETHGNTKSYRGKRRTNHRSARLVPRAWPSRHSALSPSPIPWYLPSLTLLWEIPYRREDRRVPACNSIARKEEEPYQRRRESKRIAKHAREGKRKKIGTQEELLTLTLPEPPAGNATRRCLTRWSPSLRGTEALVGGYKRAAAELADNRDRRRGSSPIRRGISWSLGWNAFWTFLFSLFLYNLVLF